MDSCAVQCWDTRERATASRLATAPVERVVTAPVVEDEMMT